MDERLQKFLARAGVASRRKAEELIEEGHVTVNGKVVRRMGVKVDAATDEVRVDTELVRAPAAAAPPAAPAAGPVTGRPDPRAVYLMMNKPVGFLCTVTDDRGRRTVMELLPQLRARVYPVGRLDEDSEGLLLFTNDGALTNLLTHPRYEVPKTYDLRVRGEVNPEEVSRVERGIWLSEGRTGPSRMRIRRRGRDISHIEMTLREGRNREVRRIFAKMRHPVLSLRRVRLGPLELEGLRPGQVRRLAPGEVSALYRAALSGGTSPGPAPHPHASRRRIRTHGQSRPFRPSNRGAPRRPGDGHAPAHGKGLAERKGFVRGKGPAERKGFIRGKGPVRGKRPGRGTGFHRGKGPRR
jgi:pseudouridine synthase